MFRNQAILLATIAIALVVTGAQAQVEIEVPGVEIRVGPDKGAAVNDRPAPLPVVEQPPQAIPAPKPPAAAARQEYRIGLAGGDVSPELRNHLGLEGVGVLVREVAANGAADKAGIKPHDILLAANDKPLATIQDLVRVVRTTGPTNKPISIKLIRRGKEKVIPITPELVDVPVALPANRLPGRAPNFPDFAGLPAMGGDAMPFQFRMLGNGMALGGGQRTVVINGVSATVKTMDDKTTVTASKGGETWEFDASDEKALEKLPADVRQVVDQAMQNGFDGPGFGIQLRMGELPAGFDGFPGPGFGERPDRQELFNHMLEMMRDRARVERRFVEQAFPENNGGEAPRLQSRDDKQPEEQPIEIEIPPEQKPVDRQ